MNELSLNGRVIAVTGGGSGIGKAFAMLSAGAGAIVVLIESSIELGTTVQRLIEDGGGSARFIATDVTVEGAVADAFSVIEREYGRLDVLHNNVGGARDVDGPVDTIEKETWAAAQDLNLTSIFYCCKYALPIIARSGGGSVINMSSVVALRGAWPQHAYAAAKGGVVALTRVLASQYAIDGIRVNAVAPGVVLTERVKHRIEVAGGDGSFGSNTVPDQQDLYPFSVSRPEDIASVVAFLAGDGSRAITGAIIPADGGLSAY